MAAVAGPGLCKNERQLMSQKPRGSITSVEPRKAPPPVKVRLKRVNCDQAIPYPPDGQAREWWQRLRNAFGTASSAFVEASLYQLIAAARLPNSGICEIAVNASLAFIEGAKPQGEVERALSLSQKSMDQPTQPHVSHPSRCGAKTRAGTPCQSPTVPGRTMPASWRP